MTEYAVWVAGIICFTVLSLALLAYWFDWAKLKAEPSKDVAKRIDAYQDDVAALRRSTGANCDELERQVARLTRAQETQAERFDTQLQRMVEERERYAALAADPSTRIGGMRRS